MIGQTLSHYKIIEKLGQGGMGEVYLAEDSRLDRKVALKILPQHLSDRAELRERFEREARAVSSLNHPHICTLHDIGEQDGIHYLVMEHLVGETLEARLAKGALPLDQTLEYAIQIADALDKAHRQGVVHRDLKPGNIMLVKSGAKLLDFGLAKLQAADTPTNLSALPTEQANLTAEGTILGTWQYMAPEQLEGKEADGRTDIFAFGAVVYEMATGRKAFEGKSQASLIAAIMGQEPRPMSELQPMTPQLLDWVVKRCLAKEPDERVQSAGDLMVELRWVSEGGVQVGFSPSITAPPLWKRAIPWSITVLMGILVISIAFWSSPQPTSSASTSFAITPPSVAPLARTRQNDVAISRDGRLILYKTVTEGGTQLYLRSLADFVDRPIPGTENVQGAFFFSPDGKSIGFFAGNGLQRIPLEGGSAVTLADVAVSRQTGTWGLDETIVFAAGFGGAAGLYRISASGGDPEILATPDPVEGTYSFGNPQLLHDGKAVLFTILGTPNRIAVLSLETGEQRILIENGKQAKYLETGHLIYEQSGNLMAAFFDPETLEVTSTAIPVLQGVRQDALRFVDYAVSDEGTLVYVPEGGGLRTLVWVDREGQEERLGADPRDYTDPRISPDGLRLAITVNDSGGGDVWIYDLEREIPTRLTFDPALDHWPIWTPDSQRVVFDSTREGANHNLFWKAADGTGPVQRLTTSPNSQGAYSFSPDGKSLVHNETSTSRNLHVMSMEDEFTSQPLLHDEFTENAAAISPSGRFIAYESNESGQFEIYVRPFPNVDDGKWQISRDGGVSPVWHPKEQELFYFDGRVLEVVSFKTQPTFTAGSPAVLFTGNFQNDPGNRQYDVAPDGQRFLMIKQELAERTQIHLVLNWFEELKRLVPINN